MTIPKLTLTEWTFIALSVGMVQTFILFFIWPERTSRTFLLVFSTIRHALRLRREAKGEHVAPIAPVKLPPGKKLVGTISSYLSTTQREVIADARAGRISDPRRSESTERETHDE